MWLLIPTFGFVFGLAVGRWWAIVGAAPLGGYILATNDLEGQVGA